MGTGIIVCGLNGAGKSTLGGCIAEKLGYCFFDNEELYFSKASPHYSYASPRTRQQAEELFFRQVNGHKSFVFAAVKGDYGAAPYPHFSHAVLI